MLSSLPMMSCSKMSSLDCSWETYCQVFQPPEPLDVWATVQTTAPAVTGNL